MKAVELREKPIAELKQLLKDERENLANLRFQLATSQLESPIRVRTVRREIATIVTVLRQKEHAAQKAAPAPAPTPAKETKA
jgi:large subunit ribosomal protein L29